MHRRGRSDGNRQERRVLEALARLEIGARVEIVRVAVRRIEVDGKEKRLIEQLKLIRGMGEGSARELLAKLGWRMMKEGIDVGTGE